MLGYSKAELLTIIKEQQVSVRGAKLEDLIPPEYFNEDMSEEYMATGELLIESKILALTDLPLLENYIYNLFQLRRINELMVVTNDISDLKRLNTMQKALTDNVLRLGKTLGIGITNRTSVKAINDSFTGAEMQSKIDEIQSDYDDGRITKEEYINRLKELE